MTICKLCESNSGCYSVKLECCQHRHIAQMPPERRKAHYEKVRKDSGDEVAAVLVAAINAERKRLRELK